MCWREWQERFSGKARAGENFLGGACSQEAGEGPGLEGQVAAAALREPRELGARGPGRVQERERGAPEQQTDRVASASH